MCCFPSQIWYFGSNWPPAVCQRIKTCVRPPANEGPKDCGGLVFGPSHQHNRHSWVPFRYHLPPHHFCCSTTYNNVSQHYSEKAVEQTWTLILELLPGDFWPIRACLPRLVLGNPSCLSITGAWNTTLDDVVGTMWGRGWEGGDILLDVGFRTLF